MRTILLAIGLFGCEKNIREVQETQALSGGQG
jgi:hypothetical protein